MVYLTHQRKGDTKMNGYKINNLPEGITSNLYVVCTMVDDELWYYGAYSTLAKAEEVAEMDDSFTIIH